MNIKKIEWKAAPYGFTNGYVGDTRVASFGPNTRRRAPNLVLDFHLAHTGRYWEVATAEEAKARAAALLDEYVRSFLDKE